MSVRLDGTRTVVRFNWPVFVGTTLASLALLSRSNRIAKLAGTIGLGGVVVSIGAVWYVYDLNRVYRLLSDPDRSAGEWAVVHVGLDDVTADILATVGSAPTAVLDISAGMKPIKAKKRLAKVIHGTPVSPDTLGVGTDSLDTVYLGFSAHEVRDPIQMQQLFGELARITRPGGEIVVAEHVVDLANLTVFGPGAFHFRTPAYWRRMAGEAGLKLRAETRLTPFVRRFSFTAP